jgi:hypothetical protein
MPPKGYTFLTINTLPEELQAVNELARARGFRFTSDYQRYLITEDAKSHGHNIDFDVDRGGYHPRKSDTQDGNKD